MYGPSCVCSSNIHLCAVVTSVIFDIFCHRAGLFLCLPQNQRSYGCCEWRRWCGLLSLTLRQEKEKDKRFISAEWPCWRNMLDWGLHKSRGKQAHTHTHTRHSSFFFLLLFISFSALHFFHTPPCLPQQHSRQHREWSALCLIKSPWYETKEVTCEC